MSNSSTAGAVSARTGSDEVPRALLPLVDVMQALYRAEINCEISSFWDGGFTVRLGDGMNGYPWEDTFEVADLPMAGRALLLAALRFCPESGLYGFDGERINEVVGWLGRTASHVDKFQCEFCGAEHLDCTLIEHSAVCFITEARTAVLEQEAAANGKDRAHSAGTQT